MLLHCAETRTLMTGHDENAWQLTECCTDAVTTRAKAKLSISTTHNDDDVWFPTKLCTDTTKATARPT